MTTTERFVERYHSALGRPGLDDPALRRTIFAALRRTLGPWLPDRKDGRILDVACGEGHFLSFLREAGYTKLRGIDLSDENVGLCHQAGLDFVSKQDVLKLAEFEPGRDFDCIFALDILEHLPKARVVEFVESLRARLAPGGTLVLRTPNMACLFGLFHRYNDPTHEFGVTENTLGDILALAGFARDGIEIRAEWNATTPLGRGRELYLRLLHRLVYLAEDSSRPHIATKNLLARAANRR
ncbi:Methyltransferase domain-containing protein [Tistlia consotensis]|uniref:Methyltransferase domain-containing protein n=1 Tax=Tistlia consotensis USBA 355 TaxID=560819 RepID=A0A1Y6BTX6_9PROT|nr:class I SAM-dependent methyltransferase [Tistlia consotensis]SMF21101.1 Methyltransferase domain-containing protein [Tistlia consotensis USBA 355]SNR47206.1 Methyltransferase domain-containing protein [Tistlia consotensis]